MSKETDKKDKDVTPFTMRVRARKIWNKHYPNDKMERYAKPRFVLHHKDKNPYNNAISNLEKVTYKEHRKLHEQEHCGRKHTEEFKKRVSLRQTENNSFAGKKHSEKTKRHWSVIRTGRKLSEEACKKLSAALKGKPKSEEHRKKLSLSKLGKSNIAWLGRRHTEESKMKMSISRKGKNIIPWNKGKGRLIYAKRESI